MMATVHDPRINTFLKTTHGIMTSTDLSASGLRVFLSILISLPILKWIWKSFRAVKVALTLFMYSPAGQCDSVAKNYMVMISLIIKFISVADTSAARGAMC